MKNRPTIFTNDNHNAKSVRSKEAQNVTVIIKIKYQFNREYLLKNGDKLLQKQIDYRNKRNQYFKEILKSYVELEDKIKALEKNLERNDSEIV